MDTALVLDELDNPTSARWAAADTGLDGLRRQLGGAMARPPTFAADLWETGSRWRSDAPDRAMRERRAVADPTRDLATLVLDGVPATVLATGDPTGALLAGLEAAAAVLLALDAVGSAQAALDLAVSYAALREQFGRVIGSYQAVAHHCADIFTLVANARSLARAAAWAVCREDPGAALAAAEAKARATENAVEAGRRAIQVHGGVGMTWARPTHVHYKRAWVDRAALGSARHQRARIVDALTATATGRAPMYRTVF